MHNIETGQAVIKHETPKDNSISIDNPEVRAKINFRMGNELNDIILSPVIGVQKVRKVLNMHGLDIPALYELDPEGDEVVLEMNQFGKVYDQYDMPQFEDDEEIFYLYLLYYLNDDGSYDFYAELTDEAGIERIMREDEDLHKLENV
jgi:hypothetical protein